MWDSSEWSGSRDAWSRSPEASSAWERFSRKWPRPSGSVSEVAAKRQTERRRSLATRDAEARGLIYTLTKAVNGVSDLMVGTEESRLATKVHALEKKVAEAEARAVESALRVSALRAQQGDDSWSPAAWRAGDDETSQRLARLYDEGLARIKAREENARNLKEYQEKQRILDLYKEGQAVVAKRREMREAYLVERERLAHQNFVDDLYEKGASRIQKLKQEGLAHLEARESKQKQLEESYEQTRLEHIRGTWAIDTDVGERQVTLMPDGFVDINTSSGESGSWRIEDAQGLEATLEMSLFLTPSPSQRTTERVFRCLVKVPNDVAFAVDHKAPGDSSMRKVHD